MRRCWSSCCGRRRSPRGGSARGIQISPVFVMADAEVDVLAAAIGRALDRLSDSFDLQQRSTSSRPPRAGGVAPVRLVTAIITVALLADGLCKGEEPVRVVPVFDLLQPSIVRSVVRLLPVGEARIDVVLVRLP
jgi:hypothetical protein